MNIMNKINDLLSCKLKELELKIKIFQLELDKTIIEQQNKYFDYGYKTALEEIKHDIEYDFSLTVVNKEYLLNKISKFTI